MSDNPYQPPPIEKSTLGLRSELDGQPARFRWRLIPTLFLGIVGGIALIIGTVGLCVTIYRIFIANLFAEGTQASPFTFYPHKTSMILECVNSILLGTLWILAARAFWKQVFKKGVAFVVYGLLGMLCLTLLGFVLRTIGW